MVKSMKTLKGTLTPQKFPQCIAPTVYTPILYRSQDNVTVLQPMMWGLIPPWHPGPSPKTHGLSTNNCRLEGLMSSKLYSPCLRTGRCVVVCQGFYEWCREGGQKTPYLVRRQGDNDEPEPLLYMAGLMSVWQDSVHSYTIITRESNDVLTWLHHRMPAFLRAEQVADWLDPSTDIPAALAMLDAGMPGEGDLVWHRVSQDVGNSRNQNPDLMNKLEEKKEKKLPGLMANWLQSSPQTNHRVVSPPVLKKKEDKSKALMNSWLKRGNDNDKETGGEKRPKL